MNISGVALGPSTHAGAPTGWRRFYTSKKISRILLLQGPVGPFFSDLQSTLSRAGVDTRRVIFNSGDQLFSSENNCIRYTGNVEQWETWLRFQMAHHKPDCIIFFGSSRPAHMTARRLAKLFDIHVLSLEEGYLRSGYVTAELDGNNQHSPLTTWKLKGHKCTGTGNLTAPIAMRSSFFMMSVWGALYYLSRDFLSGKADEDLFHRPREPVLSLSWRWCTHMVRRAFARVTEAPLRRRIHGSPGYIIVPFQVSHDSQIQKASRGWSTPKLVDPAFPK
jgi:capsular polysaccharide export protein